MSSDTQLQQLQLQQKNPNCFEVLVSVVTSRKVLSLLSWYLPLQGLLQFLQGFWKPAKNWKTSFRRQQWPACKAHACQKWSAIFQWVKSIPSWKLTYPPKMAFWVDDFPNFPRWDMLISWRVTHFSISCLGFSPGFVYEIDPRRLRKILHWSTPKMHGSNSSGRMWKTCNKCQGVKKEKTWDIDINSTKNIWWNDIMRSLYKSFKCDSVIYDCSFFFGFPRIVGKLLRWTPVTSNSSNPWRRYDLARRDAGIATLSRCMRVLKDQKPEMKEMDVSENRGTPKWMVKIMENPITMDDLGIPPIFGNIQMFSECKENCVDLVLVKKTCCNFLWHEEWHLCI